MLQFVHILYISDGCRFVATDGLLGVWLRLSASDSHASAKFEEIDPLFRTALFAVPFDERLPDLVTAQLGESPDCRFCSSAWIVQYAWLANGIERANSEHIETMLETEGLFLTFLAALATGDTAAFTL